MAVADALVTKVVDLLVSNIHQEFRRVADVENEVEKLTRSLLSIRAVLEDADRRQWKETNTVQLWLDRLVSVAYDIDDVVDEWSYKILKSQKRGKVWRSGFLSICFCFPKVVFRHRMGVKLSNLNARLDVIAIEKDRYGFQLMGSNTGRIITAPHIDISEVKGRGADQEKLVSMLLDGDSEMSKLRLIPIVGMGGIGKTTLATLVYNDERVKSHFHRRIWVCVSDPFDEIRIAKEILESLQGAQPNLASFPNIMEKIQESLVEGKDYLFVFDDVWNVDHGKWKQLVDCLKGSFSRSRILVTTRKENVGRVMGCLESDIYPVELLSEDECWELFCMIAFARRSREETVSLEEMGKEVVRRCKGLPLAIRVIAGLLQFKKRRIEWERVLGNELWVLEEAFEEIIAPLWLSYYDLPSQLKQCFLYCAIFPKDYKMEKDRLINHWVAQGYIKAHLEDMEIVGEEYFQNLVTRSFFQDVEVYKSSTLCKMHDIVHDFAQLLAKRESLRVEVSEVISINDSFAHSLRHLSICVEKKVDFHDSFYNFKKLRSLIVSLSLSLSMYGFKKAGMNLNKIFDEFTFLRTLVLSECGIDEVPRNVNRLIHLRELDLSYNNDLVELPDTISLLHK